MSLGKKQGGCKHRAVEWGGLFFLGELLEDFRVWVMPRRSREDLFSSEKRGELELIGFIPSSVGIFRSWGLCLLKSVIDEEKIGGKCKEKIPLGHSLESLYPAQGTSPPYG